MVLALVGLLVSVSPRSVHADDWRDFSWEVDLDMSTHYVSNVDRWKDTGTTKLHQGVGRLDLRGLAAKHRLGIAGKVDLELGGEVPGGFVYGFHLMPLGASVHLSGRTAIGIMGGLGFSGVVNRVPIAFELPVEGFVEVDLGRWVRLLVNARATWTPGRDARQDGAIDVGWTDEAEAGLGLVVGLRHHEYDALWSDGTYVGVMIREQEGIRLIGIVLSANMNGSSAPRGRMIPE